MSAVQAQLEEAAAANAGLQQQLAQADADKAALQAQVAQMGAEMEEMGAELQRQVGAPTSLLVAVRVSVLLRGTCVRLTMRTPCCDDRSTRLPKGTRSSLICVLSLLRQRKLCIRQRRQRQRQLNYNQQ